MKYFKYRDKRKFERDIDTLVVVFCVNIFLNFFHHCRSHSHPLFEWPVASPLFASFILLLLLLVVVGWRSFGSNAAAKFTMQRRQQQQMREDAS